MTSMAVLCVTGRLGRDSELKTTANGNSVLKFSLAVDTGYGDNKRTTWYSCDFWGKQAESVAKYLTKGRQVAVSGEPSLREYSTDAGRRQSLDVRVTSVTLIGEKQKEEQQNSEDISDTVPF